MYKILIQRIEYYKGVAQSNGTKEDTTIGTLSLTDDNGVILWRCFTLENGGESTDTPNQDKRIVARDYKLRWSSSNMNKSLSKKYPQWARKSQLGDNLVKDGTTGEAIVAWLTTNEVQGFNQRRILIHIGNTAKDTKGCILLGYKNNKNGSIGTSADCVKDFFTKLNEIGIENTILQIKEI